MCFGGAGAKIAFGILIRHTYVFYHPILADGFRRQMRWGEYALFTQRALEKKGMLEVLRRTSQLRPGVSVAAIMIYCHELAHLLVNRREPIAESLRSAVMTGMKKFADASAELAEGNPEGRWSHHSGLRPEEIRGNEHLMAQLRRYAAVARSGGKVVEELVCDVLAAVGLANYAAEGDLLAESPRWPGTLRQLGDALLVATVVIKNMQILSAADQFAMHWKTDRAGDLGSTLLDLTVRANVLTFTLNVLFCMIESNGEVPQGFPRNLSKAETSAIFTTSVARRYERIDERLEMPLQQLLDYLLNAEGDGDPPDAAEPAAIDAMRGQLPW